MGAEHPQSSHPISSHCFLSHPIPSHQTHGTTRWARDDTGLWGLGEFAGAGPASGQHGAGAGGFGGTPLCRWNTGRGR